MSDYTPTTEEHGVFLNTPTPAEYAEMKAQEARSETYRELIPVISYLLAVAGGEVTVSQEIQDTARQDIEMTRNIVDGSITLRLVGGKQ